MVGLPGVRNAMYIVFGSDTLKEGTRPKNSVSLVFLGELVRCRFRGWATAAEYGGAPHLYSGCFGRACQIELFRFLRRSRGIPRIGVNGQSKGG